MQIKTKMTTLSAAISLLTLGLASTPALAGEFRIDRLYVIGDSLSDGGSYTQPVAGGLLSAGVPGQAIPDRLRFTTNGPGSQMWNEVLADRLGIAIGPDRLTGVLDPQTGSVVAPPAVLNGGNYAEGGSRVSNPQGIGNTGTGQDFLITTLPVTTQVDRLLADSAQFGANDLIALWAGSNDGFVQFGNIAAGAITPAQGLQAMSGEAEVLLAQIDRLKAAGAQNIVVVTVPDLGTTPDAALIDSGAPGSAALLTALAGSFNSRLEAEAASKGAVVVRSSTLLNAVLADPVRYGFTASQATSMPACGINPNATGPNGFYNSSLSCIQGVNALPDSEQRLFADGVHPTSAAQALFGQAAFAGLQGAAINGVLVAAPLTPIRLHAQTLENRLTAFALTRDNASGQTELRPVGHTEYYGGAEAGRFDSDSQQVQPGLKADTLVTKFGFDRMVAPNALVGVGLSFDKADTEFSNNGGGFDSDLIVGTAFTTIALSKTFYVNGAAAMGTLDYDVQRRFMLGASQESYTASPDGDFSMFRLGGGSIHKLNSGWTLNPQLSMTWEKIELDGYSESPGAASLSFGDTEYKSERLTAALALTKAPASKDGWRPLARVSVEHDLNDDDLTIRMGPDANTLASLNAPRPDRNYNQLYLGAVKPLGGGLLSLHVASTLAQDGLDSLVAGAAWKAEF